MIPNIRQQVRYLVEIFLDARSLVIPKPRRPPRPTLAVREESQEESQEGYNNLKVSVLQSLAYVPVDQAIGFVV